MVSGINSFQSAENLKCIAIDDDTHVIPIIHDNIKNYSKTDVYITLLASV
jgi:hypothetical protein